MKTKIALIVLSAAAALGVSVNASAQIHLGVNIGVPAPVYVAPAPVYMAPPPPPPPVYVQGPPVYAPPIVVGWYGDRYYDGHRYWARQDWYRYHGYPRGEYRHDHGGWR